MLQNCILNIWPSWAPKWIQFQEWKLKFMNNRSIIYSMSYHQWSDWNLIRCYRLTVTIWIHNYNFFALPVNWSGLENSATWPVLLIVYRTGSTRIWALNFSGQTRNYKFGDFIEWCSIVKLNTLITDCTSKCFNVNEC